MAGEGCHRWIRAAERHCRGESVGTAAVRLRSGHLLVGGGGGDLLGQRPRSRPPHHRRQR
uniref:Uncharacterized protein n=1 Tax=Oryza rufipogon TaxID=4529 RepID=A0A0E0R7W0_ORYRU